MFEGVHVVEFNVLLVERIATCFQGPMASTNIMPNSKGKNITISLRSVYL